MVLLRSKNGTILYYKNFKNLVKYCPIHPNIVAVFAAASVSGSLGQMCGTVGVWQRFGQTDSEEEVRASSMPLTSWLMT